MVLPRSIRKILESRSSEADVAEATISADNLSLLLKSKATIIFSEDFFWSGKTRGIHGRKNLGNQDLLKKGEIRRDNGSVQFFSNKTKGRRITVLRGDEVLSNSSEEEKGEELDVDMESKGKAHKEDELYQTEGRKVLDGEVEDFHIHDEAKLQADDEFFDKTIQQEGMEDVENVKESDIEEYRTEEDECFKEDSVVGTSILFKDPNPASTEHVSCTLESEQGNTNKGGTALLSKKNQPAPLSSFIHTKSGNIPPILPPSSNLCMHLSNLHNRDPTDKRAVSVADPKLILNSGNATHDTFQMNVCQSESDAPINHPTKLAEVDGRVLVETEQHHSNVATSNQARYHTGECLAVQPSALTAAAKSKDCNLEPWATNQEMEAIEAVSEGFTSSKFNHCDKLSAEMVALATSASDERDSKSFLLLLSERERALALACERRNDGGGLDGGEGDRTGGGEVRKGEGVEEGTVALRMERERKRKRGRWLWCGLIFVR
ncbi:hypothetical protein LguiA_016889 [Lonicera macranthoides]